MQSVDPGPVHPSIEQLSNERLREHFRRGGRKTVGARESGMAEAVPISSQQCDCLPKTKFQICQSGWRKDQEASTLNRDLQATKKC